MPEKLKYEVVSASQLKTKKLDPLRVDETKAIVIENADEGALTIAEFLRPSEAQFFLSMLDGSLPMQSRHILMEADMMQSWFSTKLISFLKSETGTSLRTNLRSVLAAE